MRTYIRWAVIIAVVVGGGWAASHYLGEWWRKASAPRYLVATVSRGRVEHSVNSTGTVKAVQTVNVGSFVSGPLLYVGVDYNAEVRGAAKGWEVMLSWLSPGAEKGTLLAQIDPSLLQALLDRDEAALAQQEAALERERANLATQEADLKRVEALREQAWNNLGRAERLRAATKTGDYISDTEMDQFKFNHASLLAQEKVAAANIRQAEAAIRAAAQGVKQARAVLKNSTANRKYCDVYAPEDGVVIERKVDKGQTVAASFQTPELFVIAKDLYKTVHVHASVDEADIGQVRRIEARRTPIRFTVDAYQNKVYEGRIHQVRKNATTTQNVVTYPVVLEADNVHRELFPGMTATISFEVEVREGVTRIPASALRFVPPANRVHPPDLKYLDAVTAQAETGVKMSATQKTAAAKGRSRRVVWVSRDGVLHAVPVTLGLIDNQFAELVEGDLKDGAELVTGIDNTPRR